MLKDIFKYSQSDLPIFKIGAVVWVLGMAYISSGFAGNAENPTSHTALYNQIMASATMTLAWVAIVGCWIAHRHLGRATTSLSEETRRFTHEHMMNFEVAKLRNKITHNLHKVPAPYAETIWHTKKQTQEKIRSPDTEYVLIPAMHGILNGRNLTAFIYKNFQGDEENHEELNRLAFALEVDIHTFLNILEDVARAVNMGVYDADSVRTTAKHYIMDSWYLYQEYIPALREYKRKPTLCKEFEKLAVRWLADT